MQLLRNWNQNGNPLDSMVVSQPYMCVNTHACVLAYTWCIRICVYTHNVTIALQLHVHMHGGMCITLWHLPLNGVANGCNLNRVLSFNVQHTTMRCKTKWIAN